MAAGVGRVDQPKVVRARAALLGVRLLALHGRLPRLVQRAEIGDGLWVDRRRRQVHAHCVRLHATVRCGLLGRGQLGVPVALQGGEIQDDLLDYDSLLFNSDSSSGVDPF